MRATAAILAILAAGAIQSQAALAKDQKNQAFDALDKKEQIAAAGKVAAAVVGELGAGFATQVVSMVRATREHPDLRRIFRVRPRQREPLPR